MKSKIYWYFKCLFSTKFQLRKSRKNPRWFHWGVSRIKRRDDQQGCDASEDAPLHRKPAYNTSRLSAWVQEGRKSDQCWDFGRAGTYCLNKLNISSLYPTQGRRHVIILFWEIVFHFISAYWCAFLFFSFLGLCI